jgi:hypothetical protein
MRQVRPETAATVTAVREQMHDRKTGVHELTASVAAASAALASFIR